MQDSIVQGHIKRCIRCGQCYVYKIGDSFGGLFSLIWAWIHKEQTRAIADKDIFCSGCQKHVSYVKCHVQHRLDDAEFGEANPYLLYVQFPEYRLRDFDSYDGKTTHAMTGNVYYVSYRKGELFQVHSKMGKE
jgi:hypothetical protein